MSCQVGFVACDDDDDNGSGTAERVYIKDKTGRESKYVFPATVTGSGSSTVVMLTADDLTSGEISPVGDGFTIQSGTFYLDFDNEYIYSMTYNQGNGGTNVSYQLDSNGEVEEHKHYTGARFTSLGIYDEHILTLSTGDGPKSKADSEGHLPKVILCTDIDPIKETQEIVEVTDDNYDKLSVENFLGNGEYVTLCGICESNGKLFTAAVPDGMSPYGTTTYEGEIPLKDLIVTESSGSGSAKTTPGQLSGTQYPNECWVAIFPDRSLSSHKLIKTDKISYAAGRYRSQYHQMIWATDNGDVYVFSPSYAKTQADSRQQTTLPAGVVRIKSGAEEFDSDFYYKLEDKLGGRSFLRTWYLQDKKFLLRVYEEGFSGDALHLAIFDAEDGSVTEVSGLPEASLISELCHGLNKAFVENGKTYIDVSTTDGNPAFYVLDIATGVATKGATVKATSINCVTRLYFQPEATSAE